MNKGFLKHYKLEQNYWWTDSDQIRLSVYFTQGLIIKFVREEFFLIIHKTNPAWYELNILYKLVLVLKQKTALNVLVKTSLFIDLIMPSYLK